MRRRDGIFQRCPRCDGMSLVVKPYPGAEVHECANATCCYLQAWKRAELETWFPLTRVELRVVPRRAA